jgi:hypothetical protein
MIEAALALWLLAVWPMNLNAAQSARVFAMPDEAVTALGQAVNATNRVVLGSLFGSASEQLVNPDEVQGAQELAAFADAFNASHQLARASETKMILEVGTNAWPFPIPLVKQVDGWRFDTQAGVEELLNRRIGRNELEVLGVMRAYVDAQREYASRDHDGDDVL